MPTSYRQQLLPELPADLPYKITSYGAELRANKAKLTQAMVAVGLDSKMQALLLALGMAETTHLTSNQRDATKDHDGKAANIGLFNISIDLLERAGYRFDPWELNKLEKLEDLVRVLKDAFAKWGLVSTLNYVRGGYSGWVDGDSCPYFCHEYRNGIATILRAFDDHPSVLTDDSRVEVYIRHV